MKYTQALSPSKLKEAKEEFMNNYLTMANNGGVIPVDTSMEYQPLNVSDVQIDTSQVDAVKQKIYDYLGINQSIVTGNYNEDQWQAFFESIVEPFAIQISSELTEKIFSERERRLRIVLYLNHLNYSMQATNRKRTLLKSCYRWAYSRLTKRWIYSTYRMWKMGTNVFSCSIILKKH